MGEREEPVFLLILLTTAWVTLNNSFFFPSPGFNGIVKEQAVKVP